MADTIEVDHSKEEIFDTAGMTRVTANCGAGHIHYNLPVAKIFAREGATVPGLLCRISIDKTFCLKPLIVNETVRPHRA